MPPLPALACALLSTDGTAGIMENPGNADGPRDPTERRSREIADSVLDYLRECPHAMDTVDGIADWWIVRARVRTDMILLTQVLEQLTSTGVLEQVGSGDARRYRLKPGVQP